MSPTTWVIVHPEMCLVKSHYRCAYTVKYQRNRKTGKRRAVECGHEEHIFKRRMPTLMGCGHERNRKTTRIDDAAYPRLFSATWGAIVIDESHDSLIVGKRITQRRNGMAALTLRPGGKKLAMSGTPFNSHPEALWGTLNWLDPETYPAYDRWVSLYWEKGGYTGYEIGELRPDREKMLWDSLNGVALRRTKLEVAKDLPPKTYMGTPLTSDEGSPHGIWLPMEGSQADHYGQMLEESWADLDSGRLEAVSALAELTRLKQFACADGDIERRRVMRVDKIHIEFPKRFNCEACRSGKGHEGWDFKFKPKLPSNKYNWIRSSLEEWGYPRSPVDKVIIVSFYTSILEMMAARLEQDWKTGNRPVSTIISGRVPNAQRAKRLAAINSTDRHSPHVLFLNVKAGGVALTVDTASRMLFLSETRIPDQQTQAEDRIHRVSNPRPVFYYYLRSLDTVDVGTAQINVGLQAGSTRLLDERRGVEYLRNVISLSGGKR
jgi:SNF2 family DNA or RNA helicase